MHLGHSATAVDSKPDCKNNSDLNKKEEEQKQNSNMITLGDDLGTHKYMQLNTTLHMGDLPLVKKYGPLRLFTSLELLYYPGLHAKH